EAIADRSRHDESVMSRSFTADLHLGHRNIARYEPERARAAGVAPLDGPADDETQSRLDSFLIDRWNEVVGPDDEVWLLGDACMGRLKPHHRVPAPPARSHHPRPRQP